MPCIELYMFCDNTKAQAERMSRIVYTHDLYRDRGMLFKYLINTVTDW